MIACFADLRTLLIELWWIRVLIFVLVGTLIYQQTHVFLIAEGEVFIFSGPGTIAEGNSENICVRLEPTTGNPTSLDSDLTVFLSTTNGKPGKIFIHCKSVRARVYSLRDKYMYIYA